MSTDLTDLVSEHQDEVFVCALVVARIAPVVLFAPAFGGRSIPLRLRVVFALCLAALIVPVQLSGATSIVAEIHDFPRALFAEALIGSCIALSLSLVVAGLQLAGQVLGAMSGFSLARLVGNDGSAGVPAIGRLIELVALAAFLVVGGHRSVLDALLDTFRWAPVGHLPISTDLVRSTIEFASQTFIVAVRVAAPIATVLLLAIVVVGLVSRAVPQLNTMSVGLGLNAAVMLAMLSICLGSAVWIFNHEVETALDTMRAAIAAASTQ
jgi:flagellar biosynthetic protein FliR